MAGLGPTEDYFGPYYRQQRRATEVQGRAVGKPEMAPSARAAEEYGMLSAWGDRKAAEERFQAEKGFRERELGIKEEEAESTRKAGMVSGMSLLAGLGGKIGGGLLPAVMSAPMLAGGGTLGSLMGLTGGAAVGTATGAAAGAAGGVAGGVASGAAAGSVVPGLGTAIGAILGLAGGLLMSKKVICTELHRQGLLSDEIYLYDSYYGNQLPDDVLIGYQLWAIPVAEAMKRSKLLTKMVSWVAIPWANEMAHRISPQFKGSVMGKVINKVGIPFCKLIGKIVKKGSISLAFKVVF